MVISPFICSSIVHLNFKFFKKLIFNSIPIFQILNFTLIAKAKLTFVS